ncbi:Acyl carrier protein [Paenibacillus sp. UNCCL117]|uniref:acyl carrier protein n=1 Tax=unclassified Paenibacillus TaxID=185978 RepID=UPI000885F10D|nr:MULTISPECIES: acyl carrier protein [unclassified Paenibacillus]SDD05619.1 Acyl carrier protein [Paenibacillus sp. cl123]SFW31863.1 Acyl carrier protein [Paenibacillus sp. UNCCL117]
MEIRLQVKEIVADTLKLGDERQESLSDDHPLTAEGMDSINCVDMVLRLEEQFDVVFGDEELLLDNLNTIGKLSSIIEQKLGLQQPV